MKRLTEIPLSRPDITEREIDKVMSVLTSSHLSLGPRLEEFERAFARYVEVDHAIAVNSGTSGLHLAVKSLGIGGHDAVITTPFSFIASANCLLFEGARPVFVDIDPLTYNIDPANISAYIERECFRESKTGLPIDRRSGRRIKAILPVHVFGTPCDMDGIKKIADEYGLRVIEDACEAIGARFRGVKAGALGDIGVFGFYPNKQMTTGEGGMVVTNDSALAAQCASFRNQGRNLNGGWLDHRRIGYNYRLAEVNCAIGLAQLERIEEILEKRAGVAALYARILGEAVQSPADQAGGERSWFVYVVCLPDRFRAEQRDWLLDRLLEKRIGCNKYFPPIHLQPLYRNTFGFTEGAFPICESISERTIALPFYNNIRPEEVAYVAETFLELLDQAGLNEGTPLARIA